MGRLNALHRHLISGLLGLSMLAGCALYYRALWPSYDAFSRNIDPSCMVKFCDFTLFYYEQARQISEHDTPVRKYFYSPTFALMLQPLGRLPLEYAQTLWSWVQAVSLGVLLWASCLLLGSRDFPRWSHVLVVLLTLTSYPVLNNWKWGQANTGLIALVVLSLAWFDRGRTRVAAATLAAVIAARYYPAIYTCVLFSRRRYKAAAWLGLSTVLLLGAWPVLAIGANHTWNFYQASFAEIEQANRGWITVSRSTQYLPSVVQRLARQWLGKGALGPRELWVYIALGIATANLALCVWGIRQRVPRTTAWAFCFVALSTPLLVPTCWTHYFVYLPLVQTFLASELAGLRGHQVVRVLGAALGVLPSVTLSSVFYFEKVGSTRAYTHASWLLVSNMLLLALAYISLGLRRAQFRSSLHTSELSRGPAAKAHLHE